MDAEAWEGDLHSLSGGDQVRVQHQATGQWSIKGSVTEVIDHNWGDSKT